MSRERIRPSLANSERHIDMLAGNNQLVMHDPFKLNPAAIATLQGGEANPNNVNWNMNQFSVT